MTIDTNIEQLKAAITEARADEDAKSGLSVSREIKDGLALWNIQFRQNTYLTVWSSDDERETPTDKLATEIVAGWDADWDE